MKTDMGAKAAEASISLRPQPAMKVIGMKKNIIDSAE